MKGIVVPVVHCMGCGQSMMQENNGSYSPGDWYIYCVVGGCPNKDRRFKQPTTVVELEEV